MAMVEKHWYVISARAGYENHVVQALRKRIQLENVENKFSEIVVPVEEVIEMREGRKRKVPRKFFPGYILVNMAMDEQTWYLVCNTPKVLGFLGGSSDRPVPLTEQEIGNILHQMQEGADKPRPKVLFEPGEMVRVIDGQFTDYNGIVEVVNYEKNRLSISVLIFGRSTPLELEFSQVKKA